MKKRKRPARPAKETIRPALPPGLKKRAFTSYHQHLLAVAFLSIIVIILHGPIFLNDKLYDGGDSQEAIIKTHLINRYCDQTGEVPRWNPYSEAGVPNVFFLPKPVFSADFYLAKAGNVLGISIIYLLIGVIGMYFLLRYLKFNLLISIIGALTFVLAPYYRSLILVGQYMPTKFEAVMMIPWIVLAFLAYLDRKKLLYAGFFSLALSIQLLTQHYQVVYYTGILLVALGLYPLIRLLARKNYKLFFLKSTVLLLAALFAFLLVSYPFIVSKKYNEYSLRATTGLDISKPQENIEKRTGVDVNFIREWSPSLRELADFFIPSASGGTSNEKYTGNEIPEFYGKQLPAYWGKMTFSFTYIYAGFSLLLALLALVFCRNQLVIGLGCAGLLFILWSLGTTLEGFYMFFYKYLPFFKNFRTPPTSMAALFFIIPVLSAFSLKYLFYESEKRDKLFKKKVLLIIAVLLVLGLLFYLTGTSLAYVKAGQSFEKGYASLLQMARKELYFMDMKRYFVLALLFSAILIGFSFRLFNRSLSLVLTGLLLVIDFTLINNRYSNELLGKEDIQTRYFPSEPLTDFFKTDTSVYRVLPATAKGRNLAAVVPVIGDHDLLVLTTVYEMDNNNLYQKIDSLLNINWNMLKIFGVKYVVYNQELSNPRLLLKFSDPVNKDFVYQFTGYRSFGYFVKNHVVVSNAYDRLKMINNAGFDPYLTAILEKEPAAPILAADSSFSKVTRFTPNETRFELFTNKQTLFVIPIPYVEDGWTFSIDDKVVHDVYKTNHALQSVIVPPGNHTLTASFNPPIYATAYRISAILSVAFYIFLIVLGIRERKLKTRHPAGAGASNAK